MPFAWTPPGRVFVGVDLERTALLDGDGVQEGRGRWAGAAGSHGYVPPQRLGRRPDGGRSRTTSRADLGREGDGALAVAGSRGPVVLPVRWRAEEHALYAALPAETLALADAEPDAPVALTVDRVSEWRAATWSARWCRARRRSYVVGAVGSGAKSLGALATSIAPGADALVRIAVRAARVVARLVQRQRDGV